MSTSSRYIVNGDTTAAGGINTGATQGWVPLLRMANASIAFQVNLPASGAPIGTFIFETTDDDNPLVPQGVILGPVTVQLVAPYSTTFQPSDGLIRLVNFDFGPGQPVPCPTAAWMRMRYARTSGGNLLLNVGVSQKGVH
jgi:hypothetical protein